MPEKTTRNINIYSYINMYASKLLLLATRAPWGLRKAVADVVHTATILFLFFFSFFFFFFLFVMCSLSLFFYDHERKKYEIAVCISLSNVFICRHLVCDMILGFFVCSFCIFTYCIYPSSLAPCISLYSYKIIVGQRYPTVQ